MIKAIIFDWGGVLINNPANGLIEFCAKSLGIEKNNLKNIYSEYEDTFQKGIITEKELWDKICDKLKIKKPKVNSLWKEAVKHVFKDKEEVYNLINILKRNGYKIGFLSNTEIPTMEYFYDNKYEKYFDNIVFSCVEKIVKPEEKIYLIALEKLQVKPQETIFIDDKPEYIESAIKVGINGIVFKNPNQLKKELASFSVNTN